MGTKSFVNETTVEDPTEKIGCRWVVMLVLLADILLTLTGATFYVSILLNIFETYSEFDLILWLFTVLLGISIVLPLCAAVKLVSSVFSSRRLSQSVRDGHIWGLCTMIYISIAIIWLTLTLFRIVRVADLSDPYHIMKISIALRLVFMFVLGRHLRKVNDIVISQKYANRRRASSTTTTIPIFLSETAI